MKDYKPIDKFPDFVTLPENQARVEAARKRYDERASISVESRAAARATALNLKEVAALEDAKTAPGFGAVQLSEIESFDLAIHRQTFLDDVARQQDITSKDAMFWRSTYTPMVGVYMGSPYGGPPASFYVTQDFYGTMTPFTVDTEEVDVPNMGYTIRPEDLGIRDKALARSAEALKIKTEQFALNTILNQPLGTSVATSIANYVTLGQAYTGKTVYILDSEVQSSTVETSNIISRSADAGLTPGTIEAITDLAYLQSRQIRVVHIAGAGQPWRKLLRYAGVNVGTGSLPLSGPGNAGLNILPMQFQDLWSTNNGYWEGFMLNWFGKVVRFAPNNVLPQGYAFVTTDQPCVQTFNVTDVSVSVDYMKDPKNPYWSKHYEKRSMGFAAPHPWARNFQVVYFGNTSGL